MKGSVSSRGRTAMIHRVMIATEIIIRPRLTLV